VYVECPHPRCAQVITKGSLYKHKINIAKHRDCFQHRVDSKCTICLSSDAPTAVKKSENVVHCKHDKCGICTYTCASEGGMRKHVRHVNKHPNCTEVCNGFKYKANAVAKELKAKREKGNGKEDSRKKKRKSKSTEEIQKVRANVKDHIMKMTGANTYSEGLCIGVGGKEMVKALRWEKYRGYYANLREKEELWTTEQALEMQEKYQIPDRVWPTFVKDINKIGKISVHYLSIERKKDFMEGVNVNATEAGGATLDLIDYVRAVLERELADVALEDLLKYYVIKLAMDGARISRKAGVDATSVTFASPQTKKSEKENMSSKAANLFYLILEKEEADGTMKDFDALAGAIERLCSLDNLLLSLNLKCGVVDVTVKGFLVVDLKARVSLLGMKAVYHYKAKFMCCYCVVEREDVDKFDKCECRTEQHHLPGEYGVVRQRIWKVPTERVLEDCLHVALNSIGKLNSMLIKDVGNHEVSGKMIDFYETKCKIKLATSWGQDNPEKSTFAERFSHSRINRNQKLYILEHREELLDIVLTKNLSNNMTPLPFFFTCLFLFNLGTWNTFNSISMSRSFLIKIPIVRSSFLSHNTHGRSCFISIASGHGCYGSMKIFDIIIGHCR